MSKLPDNPSESFKRRNPHLYPVGAVATAQRERRPIAALDKKPRNLKGSASGVALIVTLIACRHRILDSDNSIAGFKALRDGIARTFGIDDGDPRIRFEYGQQQTDGEQGTIVKIERMP